VLRSKDSQNAIACDKALALKYKIFSLKRGNGGKYMNFNLISNSKGTGYMQQLKPAEESIYMMYMSPIEKWRTNGIDIKELKSLNQNASDILTIAYKIVDIKNQ
jgi:hypothetical protein